MLVTSLARRCSVSLNNSHTPSAPNIFYRTHCLDTMNTLFISLNTSVHYSPFLGIGQNHKTLLAAFCELLLPKSNDLGEKQNK